jgi:hypothetical protein
MNEDQKIVVTKLKCGKYAASLGWWVGPKEDHEWLAIDSLRHFMVEQKSALVTRRQSFSY